VTGERRKLHSAELHDLDCVSDIIWVIRSRRVGWAVRVARTRGKRRAYRCLVGESEGKVPHRGREPTCGGNIKGNRKIGGIPGPGGGGAFVGVWVVSAGKRDGKFSWLSVLPPTPPPPLRHRMSQQMIGFCWYKVTGKLRGSPKGAVICCKNARVVQRHFVE
jgi:hypothetical protein